MSGFGRSAMRGGRPMAREGFGRDIFRPDAIGEPRLPRDRLGRNSFPEGPMDPLAVQAQVIVVDPERRCRDYAEMFLSKMKKIGLICDIVILDQFTSPSQIVDEATARGLLYTASVTLRNEMHRSITINILQGQPQEHRNMPYEDALKLVARKFDAHLLKLGGGKSDADAIPAMMPLKNKAAEGEEIDPKLSLMLINLAEGKNLKLEDLDLVIEFLNKKREKVTGLENPGQPIATTYQQKERNSLASSLGPKPVQPPVVGGKSATTQAEDLQAKINLLFGDRSKQQSTVGMKLNSPTQAVDDNHSAHPDAKKKTSGIDFSNPTVQNALQSLMKTGPNILDSLSRGVSDSSLSATMTTAGLGHKRTDEEIEPSKPSKRAKPGRHAIAGFY